MNSNPPSKVKKGCGIGIVLAAFILGAILGLSGGFYGVTNIFRHPVKVHAHITNSEYAGYDADPDTGGDYYYLWCEYAYKDQVFTNVALGSRRGNHWDTAQYTDLWINPKDPADFSQSGPFLSIIIMIICFCLTGACVYFIPVFLISVRSPEGVLKMKGRAYVYQATVTSVNKSITDEGKTYWAITLIGNHPQTGEVRKFTHNFISVKNVSELVPIGTVVPVYVNRKLKFDYLIDLNPEIYG